MATKWRLLAVFILSCILWALVIAAATAIGKQLPPSSDHVLLRDPACTLPCLLDIVAGQTQRPDAINRLLPHSESPIDQAGFTFSFQMPDEQGSTINGILISDETGTVEYIRLYTRRWAGLGVRLADVMPGKNPSNVYRSCSDIFPVRLMLTFEGDPAISIATIVRNRVSVFSPVTMIAVSSDDSLSQQTFSTIFSGGCYIPSEWRGFGATWLYERPDVFFP